MPLTSCSLYVADAESVDSEAKFQYYFEMLRPERREKILRFTHKDDQLRSLLAGVLLRKALKDYDIPYESFRIYYGKNGKPYSLDYPTFQYNISHSGNKVILGVSNHEVGVDVEKESVDHLKVAERFFSGEEKEWLEGSSNAQERMKRFYQIWTCKESYVKADGSGLGIPFNSFTVSNISDKNFKCSLLGEKVSFWYRRDYEGYHYCICLKCCDSSLEPDIRQVRLSCGHSSGDTNEI